MNREKKIYVVDVTASPVKLSVYVSATSKTSAASFVSKNFITARMAKTTEMLGIDADDVLDADSGLPLSAKDKGNDANIIGGTDPD